MSSNKRIEKVCPICDTLFIAKQVNTRYCSDLCRSRVFRAGLKPLAPQLSGGALTPPLTPTTNTEDTLVPPSPTHPGNIQELIDVHVLSAVTRVSVRTIYRIMQQPGFPKVKVGKLLRFDKDIAVKFILERFGV